MATLPNVGRWNECCPRSVQMHLKGLLLVLSVIDGVGAAVVVADGLGGLGITASYSTLKPTFWLLPILLFAGERSTDSE